MEWGQVVLTVLGDNPADRFHNHLGDAKRRLRWGEILDLSQGRGCPAVEQDRYNNNKTTGRGVKKRGTA